jgi:hypothetical protein
VDPHRDSLARDDARVATELPDVGGGLRNERETLELFLDWYRTVVVRKVEGLPRDAAIAPFSPSRMSALGIVQHLGWVERAWSRKRLLGEEYPVPWSDEDPDADFDVADGVSVDDVIAWYRAECAAADAIWARYELDDPFEHPHMGECNIRWIYVHMIEETARHAGHLDLIAERIDGRVDD